MDLIKLFDAVKADYKVNGFVGMDFNMAVMCIISKRIKERGVTFMSGGDTHQNKLDYWARRRNFGHLQVGSEDELLEFAAKKYNLDKS